MGGPSLRLRPGEGVGGDKVLAGEAEVVGVGRGRGGCVNWAYLACGGLVCASVEGRGGGGSAPPVALAHTPAPGPHAPLKCCTGLRASLDVQLAVLLMPYGVVPRAGTQRVGPIWTGDNAAKWSHLKVSVQRGKVFLSR